MSESTDRFVASLFAEFAVDDEAVAAAALAASQPGAVPTGPKRRVRRGAFRTVAQRHKEQLTSLMTQLGSTQPHFVRCIVPNSEKRPGKMDVPIVLDQLRCNGVLEGIRIARLGYPNRLLFTEFRNRYEVLTPGIIPRGYMDGRKACQRMVEALELDRAAFKVGLTKIFFKAGVLAEMEERRDSHLFDIFSRFQGACRMFTARRQMKKILNRAAAVRTIQRNARLYVQLREWPWWQLYTKVRPLLTGTRHEEELKRKATELALITERAERDQREREALEALKFSLEAEKKRVEDALEAERSLLADKDQLLARSKERESQLEEDLAAMQVDVDQLDSQLERALVAQRTSETSRAELKTAFDAAAEHLLRLEQEQKAWQQREAGLVADLEQRSSELVTLGNQRSSHAAERAELDRKLAEKEQDVQRAEQRMAAAVAELEAKLASESRARETERLKATKLEESSRQSSHQLAELARSSADFEAQLQKREAEKSELSSQIAAITRERDSLARQISELQVRVETLTQDVKSAQGETRRAQDSSAQLQRELDETRSLMDAKTSEDSKQKELQRLKEQELQGLRSDIAALQKQKAEQEHSTAERVTSLRAEVDAARREHAELTRSHQDLTSSSSATDRQLAEATAAVAAAEQAKRAAQDQLDDVRTRAHTAEQGLQEARSAHEASERQLAASATKQRDFEDAILALERGQGAWKAKADQAALELSAESKRRELLESGARQHERNLTTLQQQHTMKDAELARLREVLAATQAELKTAQSMTNKTIVEHVHVLEEAKKYTDRQLADAQSKLQELAHYTKTLEKSKARLISDNEDLTREVSRLSQADRTVLKKVASSSAANSSAGTGSESRAVRTLENKLAEANRELQSARRDRDSAQSDARRKDLQHSEALSRSQQAYEKRIAELER
jgi:myosin protein heavy chain